MENVIDSSTPADATPSAPAAPAATPQAPAAPVAAATPSATPSTPQVEPSWLKQRLEETRNSTARQLQQQWGQTEAQYRNQLEQLQAQVRALVGVNPPQQTEHDQIRNQFKQVFPDLAALAERAKEIQAMADRAGDFESSTNHYWQTYGRQTVDSLYAKMGEHFGGNLSDEAKRQLYTSFVGYVQSSPENEARYGQDPTIVDDFVRQFTSNFVDPIRRSASAQVVNRAPSNLPQDSPGGGVPTSRPAQLGGLDERANAAWAQFGLLKGQG